MAKQIIILGSPKNNKSKGVWINKKSIGTIWVNGIPHTYNANLVYNNPVMVDEIVEDSEPKKKIIFIRRK